MKRLAVAPETRYTTGMEKQFQVADEVSRLARRGVDFTTIRYHVEDVIGRPLDDAEGLQAAEAWRSTAAERAEIYRRRAENEAAEHRAAHSMARAG